MTDAERYRWLRSRLLAADFAYGEPPVCAIVFRWPDDARIGTDLDASIDAAARVGTEGPDFSGADHRDELGDGKDEDILGGRW